MKSDSVDSVTYQRQRIKHFWPFQSGRRPILQWLIFLSSLVLLYVMALWSYRSGDRTTAHVPLPRPFLQHLNRTQTPSGDTPLASTAPPGLSVEEWQHLLKAIDWGGPESQVTSANRSTSPYRSTFTIDNLKQSYSVGEELHATIFARDFTGQSKGYGGDFFQAKVYSNKLKASVFGEVLDHQNGTYSARFILPWPGKASVAVRLIHSSEAVQVLKRHRRTESNRIYFYGFFVGKDGNGTEVKESIVCNVKWAGVVLSPGEQKNCEYRDVRTGLTWQCRRPRVLPCDALMYHSAGGYAKTMTTLEQQLMDRRKVVNKWLKADPRLITINASNATVGAKNLCGPGLSTPIPAGFYLNNVWTSFVCATRHFAVKDTTQCLKDKHVYIMGDSTSRQWFDYLISSVPTLKRMNLHTEGQVGPLMAVDVQNNADLHWRAHGLPLRCRKTPFTSLQYISNVLDEMVGGPQTVFVFNMWAHFTNYPLSYFAHRVALVRRAVVALLRRAPGTKVVIKTANTGYKDIYGSDWFSMQLDGILREAFRDVGVYILDVWQMTACHSNPEGIHPAPVIIKNEVDILLSFMCPR
ncbi:NXPE family member 3-like [Engraulis encrasicolus]|uniref:NXPE family member 3-like n=1 Tax=Engraulis encrasicolus TaxID=184585 RepID=UPI002FD707EE